MSGNITGRIFRFISFGESHGPGVGVVIEGIKSGVEIDLTSIQNQLSRRRPGQSAITTSRNETDELKVLSGLYLGKTLGSPLCFFISNNDHRPGDYSQLETVYRPGHADFAYDAKYGFRDPRGGGRSSARITAGWVAAGSLAEQLLKLENNIEIVAWVSQVGEVEMKQSEYNWSRQEVDSTPVRCPDKPAAENMQKSIAQAQLAGDSLGGIITCVIRNCPAGLGEPVFEKLQTRLGASMLSINAVKGVEFGDGFASAAMRGSEFNDAIISGNTHGIQTLSNHSGGIQGGISNGNEIVFKVVFRPTSTISVSQNTITKEGKSTELKAQGRHDPCVVPRAVPIVESMAAAVLYDLWLMQKAFGE